MYGGFAGGVVILTAFAYGAGPAVMELYNTHATKAEQNKVDEYDAAVAMVDVKLSEITALEALPPKLEQFTVEYKSLLEQQVEAEKRMAAYEQYQKTVLALEALASKKAKEDAVQGDVDQQCILEHLESAFGDSQLHAASIDEAIAALESIVAETPVVYGATGESVYQEYIKSPKFASDREAALAALTAEQ